MTLGVVKPTIFAEYEIETGERKFTKYVERPEDVVDIVGEEGGVILRIYQKIDGKIYRKFGSQLVEYKGAADGWDKAMQGMLESGDYNTP